MAAPGSYSGKRGGMMNPMTKGVGSGAKAAGSQAGKAVAKTTKGSSKVSVARVKTQKGHIKKIAAPARKGTPSGMVKKGTVGKGAATNRPMKTVGRGK
jgi:hypothetical protein